VRPVGASPLVLNGGPPGSQPGGLWVEKKGADPLDLRLRYISGAPTHGTEARRVMSFNPGEGASNRVSSRLRAPSVVQYPRAQRG